MKVFKVYGYNSSRILSVIFLYYFEAYMTGNDFSEHDDSKVFYLYKNHFTQNNIDYLMEVECNHSYSDEKHLVKHLKGDTILFDCLEYINNYLFSGYKINYPIDQIKKMIHSRILICMHICKKLKDPKYVVPQIVYRYLEKTALEIFEGDLELIDSYEIENTVENVADSVVTIHVSLNKLENPRTKEDGIKSGPIGVLFRYLYKKGVFGKFKHVKELLVALTDYSKQAFDLMVKEKPNEENHYSFRKELNDFLKTYNYVEADSPREIIGSNDLDESDICQLVKDLHNSKFFKPEIGISLVIDKFNQYSKVKVGKIVNDKEKSRMKLAHFYKAFYSSKKPIY